MRTLLAALLALPLASAGCAGSERAPEATPQGLTRARYVLPPEPPPPRPRSDEELWALEAEWPPVPLTFTLGPVQVITTGSSASSPSFRRVRHYPRWSPTVRHWTATRRRDRRPMVVRIHRAPHEGPPGIIMVETQ